MSILKALISLVKAVVRKIREKKDPVGYARSIGVRVGKDCRLINVSFGSDPYLITLGNHVSATRTEFITHDGGVWVFRQKEPDVDLIAPIKVGDNVYFGAQTIVLPGVTIGNNVIVGAGAIVTKDIPSNCVVVGVPAKLIKTIDEYYESNKDKFFATKTMSDEETRERLLEHFGLK